jgi:hypothetical protein
LFVSLHGLRAQIIFEPQEPELRAWRRSAQIGPFIGQSAKPMENSMHQTITIAAAFAILSLGMLASGGAYAGGSTSAPSKYNNVAYSASVANSHRAHAVGYAITEFSSSSARTTPKR